MMNKRRILKILVLLSYPLTLGVVFECKLIIWLFDKYEVEKYI